MNKIVHSCTCGNCIKTRYTFSGGHYIYEYIHELNAKLNELDSEMLLDIQEIEKEKKKSKLANKKIFDMEIKYVQENYAIIKNALCDGYFIHTPDLPPPLPTKPPPKLKKE
jgi:predicted oxidoreductase